MLEDAVELVAELPFIQTMRMLSLLAGAVYHAHTNADGHRRLAEFLYGDVPDLLPRVLDFLDGGRNRLAFDPRHIAALQRLAVLHAADRDEQAWTVSHHRLLVGALLAVGGALPHGDPDDEASSGAPPSMEAWTRYLAQVGLYYGNSWVAETMARAWSRYVTVAADLSGRPEACPIDAWLLEDLRFTLAEQVALGLAYGQGSDAFVGPLSLEDRIAHRPRPGFLQDTALADREPEAVALISADRDELRAMLEAEKPDPMHVGWDHAAFESRPFLRDAEGFLLLHSPQALMSWMTRGLHYRALDAANRRFDEKGCKLGGRWLTYAGALGEESVRRLLQSSFPDNATRSTFHGELEFRGAGDHLDRPRRA